MATGYVIRWLERRGSGWSSTEYRGIEVNLGDEIAIISLLSHGPRVVPFPALEDIKLIGNREQVVISRDDIHAARVMLSCDRGFSRQITPTLKRIFPE